MITIQTGGPTNDLIVQNGDLVLISEDAQTAQMVRETLATFLGEWFLDNTIGVAWFQDILVSNPNLDTIQMLLLVAITDVPGVQSLNNFQFGFVPETRALSVTVQIQTTNGQTLNLEQTVGI